MLLYFRLNPVTRIIDAVKEPKTKFALLTEIISSDDVTKVYTEKKREKHKTFTLRNWLKIYGIEFPDDDDMWEAGHDKKKMPPTPTKIKSAKTMSSDKCSFIRRQECNEAGYYPCQIQYTINTPKHGAELVLEDIEGTTDLEDNL